MGEEPKTASRSQLKSGEYDVAYSHGAVVLPVNSTDVGGSLPFTRQSEKIWKVFKLMKRTWKLVEDEAWLPGG
jgi:hypothetical protein